MATRERKIFSNLQGKVDAVVLANGTEPNIDLTFFYATGITSGLFEGCYAIITPRRVEVLASDLEELSARRAGVKTTTFETKAQRDEILSRMLEGFERIGVNAEEITYANYRHLKKCARKARLVDVSKQLANARMTKDEEEVARIRKACAIASRIAEEIPDLVKEGDIETGAAAELNYMMMKLGAEGPAFGTNASFGGATAEPHHVPGTGRLRKGQLALFDFGAMYKRYVSDITRTFVCKRASRDQREMHEIVLSAQLAALDAIRDGAHGKDVDRAAREVIDRSRLKGRFIHSTGHGIGLSVHDPGAISSHRDMVLREGMVLTVEPGAYVKGEGGVRIEDDVLVTRNGCKVLTKASKDLEVL